MPAIHYDPAFEQSFKIFTKRNKRLKLKIIKSLTLFATNPQHPSLHLEKLTNKHIWTIRLDKGNRLFFIWSEKKDTAIFFHVGKHDLYKTI